MSNVQDIQNKIVEDFSKISSWEDRYKKIIDLGKTLGDFPEEKKEDKYKVSGCQSLVYLIAELRDGKVHFHAWSDALIVGGLISLLLRVYSGQSTATIMQTEPTFITEIGLEKHLSPTRSNGLRAMIKQMKLYAYVLSMQQKS